MISSIKKCFAGKRHVGTHGPCVRALIIVHLCFILLERTHEPCVPTCLKVCNSFTRPCVYLSTVLGGRTGRTSLHAYRSHSAIQSQPYCAVISVFLHGNISHFAMLSQSYGFACAVLPPPTNVACDTRDMFFGFVCMQRYKILQAIARLSQIFL